MAGSRRGRGAVGCAALAAAVALLPACTASSTQATDTTPAAPASASPPAQEAPTTPTPSPAQAAPEPSATPDPSVTPETPQTPLVLATHLTLPQVRVASADMRTLLVEGFEAGVPGGLPGSTTSLVIAPGVVAPAVGTAGVVRASSAREVVRAVRADRGTVGLLPAHAMDATVRAARVDRVHPLRNPDGYPLTTAGRAPDGVVTISIGGDVMMDRRVGQSLAASGDYAAPFRPIAQRLSSADITVVNLESTLAELGPPTQGIESFVADPRIRSGLRLAGVDVVSLANNHSGDYGPASLLATIDLLRQGGFTTFGAGANRVRADRPAIVSHDGVSVAFVGFNAIGETPTAARGQPGASSLSMPPRTGPLDRARLGQIQAQVASLSEEVDVVVVVPHWGQQYTAEPVPEQSRVGRAMLAAGADIVVGGHPHWVQAVERSRDGRLVVHSLGNLVFDMDFSVETMQGVVAEVIVWDDRVVGVDYVPYVIGADWVPRWVDPEGRGEPILNRMWEASDQPFASSG